jgi:hypothetical protein
LMIITRLCPGGIGFALTYVPRSVGNIAWDPGPGVRSHLIVPEMLPVFATDAL